MPVLVGTSGWQYRDWRGRFYPERLAQARWLEHYADRFATVESNNAFYRLPEPATFEGWAARTPPDFVMAVKASRYLTHIRRLRDPDAPVHRLLDHARRLGGKLGPVLLQLPPTLQFDGDALGQTLRAFPPAVRVAVEPRHESWFRDEVRDLLAEHGARRCGAPRTGPTCACTRAPPRRGPATAARRWPPGPAASPTWSVRTPTPTSTSTTTRRAARSATPACSRWRRPAPACDRPGCRPPPRCASARPLGAGGLRRGPRRVGPGPRPRSRRCRPGRRPPRRPARPPGRSAPPPAPRGRPGSGCR